MPSQDEIIHSTEMVFEENRKILFNLKNIATDKNSLNYLENIFFEAVVLLYTHRTIWTKTQFWQEYAQAEQFDEFQKAAYKQMITCTLVTFYNNLYFAIEGAFSQLIKCRKSEGIISLFKKINNLNKIQNYDEINKGLEILRCVRNSFHGDKGNNIFKFKDTNILFKEKSYNFYKDEPVSVSYEFLKDFIPLLTELYKSLFVKSSKI